MEIKEAMEAMLLQENYDRDAISHKIGVTKGQLSHYIIQGKPPRLNVAGRIWGNYGLVVEPFTETAVIKQWGQDNGN